MASSSNTSLSSPEITPLITFLPSFYPIIKSVKFEKISFDNTGILLNILRSFGNSPKNNAKFKGNIKA